MKDNMTTAQARKQHPVATGVLDYFPDALLAIANVSRVGNDQHNPGQPLHWDRSKSTDELDALIRHALHELVAPGSFDASGQEPVLHAAKVAWRALAHLQKTIEAQKTGRPWGQQ